MRAASAAVMAVAAALLAGCGGDDDKEPAPVASGQAVEQLGRAFPDAVERAKPVSNDIDPRLTGAGPKLRLERSLASGEVSRQGGAFVLTTPAGALEAGPLPEGGEGRLLAGDQAVLYAGAAPDADLLVRASPAGYTTYVLFRDRSSPSPFAWRITPPAGGRAEELPKGNVGIVVKGGQGGVSSPSVPGGGRLVATVSAPLALDARGRKVKASLRVEGKEMRLAIAPGDSAAFPVAARLEWIPSGELGGGWFGYGVDVALRRSAYSVSGKKIEGLCAEEEKGTLDPGEVEASRQVASRRSDCRSLVETGNP